MNNNTKVTLIIFILSITTIVLVFLLKPNGSVEPKISEDDCGLSNIDFQEVIDTTHILQSGSLEAAVKVNGNIVINPKLKLDSIGANIKNGNKVFIDRRTYKTFIVSQDFWEKFTRNRQALCALIQAQKNGRLSAKSNEEVAKLYLEIVRMFSGLDEVKEGRKIMAENTFQLSIDKIEARDRSDIIKRIESTSSLRWVQNGAKYKINISFDESEIKFDRDIDSWHINSSPILLSLNDNAPFVIGSITYSGSADKVILEKIYKGKMIAFLKGYNYKNITSK